MFTKLLVANRGEIACRVMKTARRMGIATVAVYSEADQGALHLALADEAISIGSAAVSESYLNIDNILQACQKTGAQAVHPGYGFLSENAEFSTRLEKSEIVFIGPSAIAITSMGDKLASKKLASSAGVNTIPGHDCVLHDASEAVSIAKQIGYPIMLKASAGGGGKGMRVAHNERECREGFERAASEARASFGDDRLLIEKFIPEPRHIEIQVLGDQHGNMIHLGERECSLQRRHQKVIEESPSPLVDQPLREIMGEQAVALARAVDYVSAGTVEFLVDADRNFYFLEMNTRLQVEHPVTELVTGLDLVELMIRIAAGEALPLSQADVALRGWAIEARVYAEDPFRKFLPSAGRLVRYVPPAESEGVRVDTGVVEGGEVSIHYDPMIAKLITAGETRCQAIERMRRALDEFTIRGISHNLRFLSALVGHPRFVAGQLSTELIAEEYPQGFQAADVLHDQPSWLIAVGGVIHRLYRERAAQISGQLPGYRPPVEKDWVVVLNGVKHVVSINPEEDGYSVTLGETTLHVRADWQFGQPLFWACVEGEEICVQVERRDLTYRLSHRAAEFDLLVLSARSAQLLDRMPNKAPPDTSRYLLSPMPGLLAQLTVAVGDQVKVGQDVAIVEAMKMENVLRAERAAKVSSLHANVGDTLEVDQPIVEFE